MVCVLGNHAAEYLFQGGNPLGHRVKLDGLPFEVIGVLESKGSGAGGAMSIIMDDVIVAPITTVQSRLLKQRTATGSWGVHSISVQVSDEGQLEATKVQISDLLRQRHHLRPNEDDDFTIVSQKMFQDLLSGVTMVLTVFLGCIAGISLLVGGIGIMNIMLVSVRERTREIGIRKAVGAKRRDILMQFLIESAILSLSGGIIGLILGWGGSKAISLINIGAQPLQAVVSGDIVAIAFGVAVAIGLFFGIYPAYQAARLSPIDALRYE
jgi:putative ABC transport system permease protein